MISVYKEILSKTIDNYRKLTKKYNYVGFLRLTTVSISIVCFYLFFQKFELKYLFIIIFTAILFLFLIVWHKKIAFQRKIEISKAEINQNEINFLENNQYFSDNGLEFQQKSHLYAYDLDVFGEKSLFHHINRTKTFQGRKFLASCFLNPKETEIKMNQEGIAELAELFDWRQEFGALASQVNDSADFHEKITQWINQKDRFFSKFFTFFAIVSPLLLISCSILGFVFDFVQFRSWAILLFIINLGAFGYMFGVIQRNKIAFEGTSKILNSYQKSIDFIEKSRFKTEKLNKIQQKLIQKEKKASNFIRKLSNLLDDLDNLGNVLASAPLNCLTFYHFYVYSNLIQWKKEHEPSILTWLEAIGEMEALSSFANFKYNNPQYVFPELNANYRIDFEDLGHPLIADKQRVVNSISFSEHKFVILTGSNMSGKSTFLRALGVNMLFTTMGLPVCARKANVHPLKILVSMRLSDSLTDGKSYFFSEIYRIQKIIQTLENERCFVLLDELLRGTNSQDKQLGTIKIIEKMVKLNALGVIATHDIEVCKLTEKYPQVLQNKCFEVSIKNNELHFDYKIRDGICQNKNATFLMKKMEIID